jgi:hypothetical protein
MGETKKASVSAQPPVGEFRPGLAGTCEAHLFEFSNYKLNNLDAGLDPDKTIATTHRIAASSMLQAVEYMAKHEPQFQIQSVRRIGIIVLLSGSRYN